MSNITFNWQSWNMHLYPWKPDEVRCSLNTWRDVSGTCWTLTSQLFTRRRTRGGAWLSSGHCLWCSGTDAWSWTTLSDYSGSQPITLMRTTHTESCFHHVRGPIDLHTFPGDLNQVYILKCKFWFKGTMSSVLKRRLSSTLTQCKHIYVPTALLICGHTLPFLQ